MFRELDLWVTIEVSFLNSAATLGLWEESWLLSLLGDLTVFWLWEIIDSEVVVFIVFLLISGRMPLFLCPSINWGSP